jgi:hypothetical protein
MERRRYDIRVRPIAQPFNAQICLCRHQPDRAIRQRQKEIALLAPLFKAIATTTMMKCINAHSF